MNDLQSNLSTKNINQSTHKYLIPCRYYHLVLTLQFLLNAFEFLWLTDLQDAIDFGRTAKQLDCTGIAHAQIRIAVDREIVDEDVRDGEAARRL